MKTSSLLAILPLYSAVWVIGVIADASTSPTIEGVLTEAAKQIPALCALIWIVYQFLGHLRAMADAYSKSLQSVATAMDKHTEMTGRMLEACIRMERIVERDRMDNARDSREDRS